MDSKLLLAFSDNDLTLRLFCASQINKERRRKFDIDNYSENDCKNYFRFTKQQIYRLKSLLHIPFKIKGRNGLSCPGLEALCILLRRMAYPNRLIDLKTMFHRCTSNLSLIINYMLKHILERFEYLLTELDQWWLSDAWMRKYADAVSSKGAPLRNCWGFIDGTVRCISRPSKYQKECYNGHKRVYALKYQSVTIPTGLIANLFGPVEGRRHDAFMLAESGILNTLMTLNARRQNPFYIYGDPAYPLRPELMAPFRGSNLTSDQALFNKRMSEVRVSVEWMFGRLLQLWAFVDYKKNQKLYLQPVAKYFKLAALLTNIHACMNGNQVSIFFDMDPPAVEDYLILKV